MNRKNILLATTLCLVLPLPLYAHVPSYGGAHDGIIRRQALLNPEASALFAAALKSAQKLQDADDKAKYLCLIAEAQGTLGDFVGAMKTLALSPAPTQVRVETFCSMARAQAARGDMTAVNVTFQKALATAAKIQAKSSTDYSTALSSIAGAQVDTGDTAGAMKTAALAKEDDNRAYVLTAIALALSKRGEDDTAHKTLERINPTTGTQQYALGQLLDAQIDTKKTEAAQKTLGILIKDFATGGLSNPHDYHPAQVARLVAEGGNIPGAQALAEKFKLHDEYGSALCYIAVAQQKAGDGEGAKESLTRANECVESISDIDYLVELATMQTVAGDKQNATNTFAKAAAIAMKESDTFTRQDCFQRIALGQAEAGDKAGAALSFQTALKIASRESEDRRGEAIGRVAEAQARAKDFVGANLTAAKIKEDSYRLQYMGTVAALQAQAGDVPGALALIAKNEDDWFKHEAYSKIIAAQVAAKDIVGAKATLAKMDKAYPPSIAAMVTIAKAVGENGATAK